jgi:hypothetical protein
MAVERDGIHLIVVCIRSCHVKGDLLSGGDNAIKIYSE